MYVFLKRLNLNKEHYLITQKNNAHEWFIISGKEGQKYKICLLSVVNNSIEILNLIYIVRLFIFVVFTVD